MNLFLPNNRLGGTKVSTSEKAKQAPATHYSSLITHLPVKASSQNQRKYKHSHAARDSTQGGAVPT